MDHNISCAIDLKVIAMHPIKLALVRQQYRPDGGGERFVSQVLRVLKSHVNVHIITRSWQDGLISEQQIHRCNPWGCGRVQRERHFARSTKALWQDKKFDLIQSHERIPGCDIYRAGDGVHRRWLQQRVKLLPRWRAKWLFSDPYHRYVMQSEQALYRSPQLKAIICNAELVKKEIIEEFGVEADKIHIIRNVVDHQAFSPCDEITKAVLRQQWQIPVNATCLIFIGSGFERKGLNAAIKAIAGTDRHLLVVGQDKKEKIYHDLCQRLNCQNRVHFLGMQVTTLPFYQMADGLLLPTLYDPFPNVILEAMACGLPVITTPTCGGAEFIVDGQNGFICDALDIAALRDAIMALPSQSVESSFALAAREGVITNTPQRLSLELVAFYQQVMDRCVY